MLRDRLKALRAEHGLSQQDLANLLGLERSSVAKYEGRQPVTPSTEVLTQMATLFNVTTDYLLDRADEAKSEELPLEDNVILLSDHGRRIIRRIPREKMPFLREMIEHIAEDA